MPRHKAATWVGPGRKRKSTQPGASGVIELAPFEFLDRLANLIPQPRKHRHRYHGVFAPNHPLRPAVTALAVGNVGKKRMAATGGHADGRPIRTILTHLGEPLEPPPISPARGPPTDWGELAQKNATPEGEGRRTGKGLVRAGRQEHATHQPLISSEMVQQVPLAGLSLRGFSGVSAEQSAA